MNENNYFNEALSNYINDFANSGAIKHYVDLEYSIEEIIKNLDFKISKDKVAKCVYNYYIEKGTIKTSLPDSTNDYIYTTEYVKDYNKFGSTSLRKITKRTKKENTSYEKCDLGKIKYNDESKFNSIISMLPREYRKMLVDIPWPLTTIYIDTKTIIGQAVVAFNGLL